MSKYLRLSSLILAAIFVIAGCAPAAQPTAAPGEPTADINAAVQKTVVALETKMSGDLTAQAPLATPTEAAPTDTATPESAVVPPPPTPTNFVVIFPAATSGSSDSSGGGGGVPVQQKYQCSLVSQSPVNGSSVSPKDDFDAIWTVKNTGWKMWETTEVDFYYVSGQKMQQHDDLFDLPNAVGSGKTIKLKVDMGAPKTAGTYATYWALKVGGQAFCNFSMIIKVK